jgi:hypothetical protein
MRKNRRTGSVDRVEGHRLGAHAGHHRELAHRSASSVRDGDAEADPGALDRLPLHDRVEDFLMTRAGEAGEQSGERRNGRLSVGRLERHHDPVRREQFGQEHGAAARRCIGQT